MTNLSYACYLLDLLNIPFSIEYSGGMTIIDTEEHRFFYTGDGKHYGTITKLPFEYEV